MRLLASSDSHTQLPALQPLAHALMLALLGLSGLLAVSTNVQAQTVSERIWTQEETPAPPPVVEEKLPYCDDVLPSDTRLRASENTLAVADQMVSAINQNVNLKGRACISRGELRVQGDRMDYDYPSEHISVNGNVKMRQAGDGSMSGDALQYNIATETGRITPANFTTATNGGRGQAESLTLLSQRRALLTQARYTSCQADDPDWYIKTDSLILDQDSDQGTARNATLVFKNVPILASPYLRIPLGNQRQSGVLTPTLGYSTRNGTSLVVPYYFNLAPNYDATLYPGVMSERGVKLGAEFRYLMPWGSGQLYGDYMPNDRKLDRKRYYWLAEHNSSGALGAGRWRADVKWQKVSDNEYIDDFGSRINDIAARALPSTFALQYKDDDWLVRLRRKTYQTLQNNDNSIEVPYDFEPQLNMQYKKRWNRWLFALQGESVRFTHPDTATHAQGWRNWLYPSLSYEWRQPGAFIIPKLGIHATQYALSRTPALNGTQYDANASRIVPIFSLNSGLVAERQTQWFNQPVVQTLEPRLYYTYIPYRDQSRIWNFDSAVADLDFSRIYTENLFTGNDRIAQANQITLGVTSRVLSQKSGEELLQASIAQRHYLDTQKVTLPNTAMSVNTERKSDLLAAVSGRMYKDVWAQGFAQYNVSSGKLLRADAAIHWQPAYRKVLNVGYHENRVLTEPSRSLYASTQFPVPKLNNRLYAVGRINYDLKNSRTSNLYAGFEYAKDCWILRLVAQRELISNNRYNNGVFFQLELKGLGNLGQNTERVLVEQIQGYHPATFTQPIKP